MAPREGSGCGCDCPLSGQKKGYTPEGFRRGCRALRVYPSGLRRARQGGKPRMGPSETLYVGFGRAMRCSTPQHCYPVEARRTGL